MSKRTQGRWLGSSIVMAGMVAIFVAAGGLGAPGCSGGGENPPSADGGGDGQLRGTPGGNGGQEDGGDDPARVKIVALDLPGCVDRGMRGVIHLDRDSTGELVLELLYRSNVDAQTRSDDSVETLADTARRATARFQGSSSASFDFGQFSMPGDAQCFTIELERTNGAGWINFGSWQRRNRDRACIPLCSQTTTTTTHGSTTVSTSTVSTTTSTTTPTTTTSTTTAPTTMTSTTTTSTTTVPTTTTSTTTVPTTTSTTTAPTTTTSTTTVPTTTTSTTISSTTSTTTYSHKGYCLVDPGSGEMTGQCQSWDPYAPACFVGDAPSVCSGNTNDAFGASPCGDGTYVTGIICRF